MFHQSIAGSVYELDHLTSRIREAIERNADQSRRTDAGQTSRFWSDIFATRPNFPDVNQLMVFRREGYAYGIGDDRQGERTREREYSARMSHIFRPMVDGDLLSRLPEPMLGAPLAFNHDGISCSSSFLINAATTQMVTAFVHKYGMPGPLRVLEIGAGWGAVAYQLHFTLDVQSYTIVDLPENLFLSTVYLGSTLPGRRVQILDVKGPRLNEIAPGNIAGCLPGTIDRIEGQFDLILNSFSLQEMALESVHVYTNWIESVLSDDGIFVSLNAHGKAGVRRPSDYGYERFHIHHWRAFRKNPSGFFNTIPYAVVAGRRRANSPDYPSAFQDVLGQLIQFGLDNDIAPLCDAVVAGSISEPQLTLLGIWSKVFGTRNVDERDRHLAAAAISDVSAVTPFLQAHAALLRKDMPAARALLELAASRGLSGFARARAEVILATLQVGPKSRWPFGTPTREPAHIAPVEGLDVTFAYPEASSLVVNGDLGPIISHAQRIFDSEAT